MDDDGVPEPFTMPIPPGFPPPPHGGDRVLFFRTHETEGDSLRKGTTRTSCCGASPREVAMRYRAAAGGRAMTHAQYLTALVELHARISASGRTAATRPRGAVLEELGLQTVAV